MVANPNSLGSVVKSHPEKAIAEEIRDLKRRIRSLESVRATSTVQPSAVADPYTPTTTLATVATLPVTVPGGFTTAAILVAGTVTATRTGGAAGVLYLQNTIGTVSADTDFYNFPASTTDATCVQVFGTTVTGLSNGDTITLSLQCGTTSGTPWDSLGGSGNLYAFITYLR